MTIASKELRQQRGRLGMTQAQLAEALGVSRGTVVRWEGGTMAIDKPQMLALALAELRRRKRARTR